MIDCVQSRSFPCLTCVQYHDVGYIHTTSCIGGIISRAKSAIILWTRTFTRRPCLPHVSTWSVRSKLKKVTSLIFLIYEKFHLNKDLDKFRIRKSMARDDDCIRSLQPSQRFFVDLCFDITLPKRVYAASWKSHDHQHDHWSSYFLKRFRTQNAFAFASINFPPRNKHPLWNSNHLFFFWQQPLPLLSLVFPMSVPASQVCPFFWELLAMKDDSYDDTWFYSFLKATMFCRMRRKLRQVHPTRLAFVASVQTNCRDEDDD